MFFQFYSGMTQYFENIEFEQGKKKTPATAKTPE